VLLDAIVAGNGSTHQVQLNAGDIQTILDVDLYVAPMVNPDGYEFSRRRLETLESTRMRAAGARIAVRRPIHAAIATCPGNK
jgi:hypothetical protein